MRGPFFSPVICAVFFMRGDPMETFIFILEIIGTVAFSISGAMTAIKKRMDIFGVVTLGLITAVGGGVIRDLVLGITPPHTFNNPAYALASALTSICVFLPAVRRFFRRHTYLYDHMLFYMDTIGLAIFTVVGVQIAAAHAQQVSMFLFVFVGVVTGVGGGVLRDVLAQNTPYIFVKHVYASASLIGALICALLWKTPVPAAAMPVGAAVIIAIRMMSSHFRWSLPHPRDDEPSNVEK